MHGEVDHFGGMATSLKRSLQYDLRRADERYNRAVMRGIGLPVQHLRPWHRGDGCDNRIDHFRPAAFAEVWNAFDDLLHEIVSSRENYAQATQKGP